MTVRPLLCSRCEWVKSFFITFHLDDMKKVYALTNACLASYLKRNQANQNPNVYYVMITDIVSVRTHLSRRLHQYNLSNGKT